MGIRADIRQTAVTFSATEPRRPFLVIVRAGDHSLHKNWMRKGASRQWDLLVDYYGKKPDYTDPFADFVNQGGVTKFPSVKAIDEANPGFLRDYRAIYFLDDDIDLAFGDIDRLFEIFMRHDLWLAQPSLTHDSHHTHQIVLHSPLFELRFTNFVEIMAPVMSQSAFAACIETFEQSISGFGLDFVWPALLGAPRDRIAIIDSVRMRHSKETDFQEGAFYRLLRSIGIDPVAETHAVVRRHGIDLEKFAFHTYHAVPAPDMAWTNSVPPEVELYLSTVRASLPEFFDGVSAVQFGAFGKNATDYFKRAKEFVGIDLMPGPGVDVAKPYHEAWLGRLFDVALSIDSFEHDPHYRNTFINMIRHTGPGALVLFSCASTGHLEHGTRESTPADSPTTIALGLNHYCNLDARDFTGFPFVEAFEGWRFFRDLRSHKLFFLGIRRSSKAKNWEAVLEKIGTEIAEAELAAVAQHPRADVDRLSPRRVVEFASPASEETTTEP
jgi:hypothetical protein